MASLSQELYDLAMVLYEESRYVEAIDLFKEAADQGHLPSAEKLANCYNRSGSSELAVPYWEICRKANNHSANTNYAGYLKEFSDKQDLAMELWVNAADAGIAQAAFNLGVWLKNINRVEEGKVYLKKSGDLGYLDGYFVLAGIFYRAEEWVQAKDALDPLIAIDDPRAQTMMGVITQKIYTVTQPVLNRNEGQSNKSGIDWS
jgi:TPR repeat protein